MIIYQGDINNHTLSNSARKIVSLVPSLTWYLFDLNLHDHIKGITKFCFAAENQQAGYPFIGGTKSPDISKILSISPDLIFANKEENRKKDIEALAEHHLVYLSDIKDLSSMYIMMKEISILTNREKLGEDYILEIKNKEKEFISFQSTSVCITAVYLIWKDPYMTVGSDTFIHYMMNFSGFKNCFGNFNRYPEISKEEICDKTPAVILLSSEPYPFKTKHINEFYPINCRLVDGRIFSWYGSFILQSFEYLDAFKKSLIKQK